MLRELAHVPSRLLAIIIERLWILGRPLTIGEREALPPSSKKDVGMTYMYRELVSLPGVPGKIQKLVLVVCVFVQKEMTVNSLHRLIKRKSCLMYLIDFCDKMTRSDEKVRAMENIYLSPSIV